MNLRPAWAIETDPEKGLVGLWRVGREQDPPYTAGRNIKWYNHFEKQKVR